MQLLKTVLTVAAFSDKTLFSCGLVLIMVKSSRCRVASHRAKQKTRRNDGGHGEARLCFRCGERFNNCVARGRKPYKHKLTLRSLQSFEHALEKLNELDDPVRYHSDCVARYIIMLCKEALIFNPAK